MSLSGLKDVDREVLKHVDDEELLNICTINKKTWNEVCDDNFLRRRLSKYPGIEKYKRDDESWKEFFLRTVYYIAKMKEDFKFEYSGGDFKKQYEFLIKYKPLNMLLIESAKEGELSLVKYALKKGVDIHSSRDAALRNASRRHLKIVKYLVEHGANIHAIGEEALRVSVLYGQLDIVKYLVEHGANIHLSNDLVLTLANKKGHSEIVKYLLEQGADIRALMRQL